MLSLYRYSYDNDNLIAKILSVCAANCIACYIPNGNFDDWIYSGRDGSISFVKHIDRDERFEFV